MIIVLVKVLGQKWIFNNIFICHTYPTLTNMTIFIVRDVRAVLHSSDVVFTSLIFLILSFMKGNLIKCHCCHHDVLNKFRLWWVSITQEKANVDVFQLFLMDLYNSLS